MQKTKKRAVSVLLSVLLLTALFVAIPMTALAASGSYDIVSSKDVSDLRTEIQVLTNGMGPGDVLTVTGSKTDADAVLGISIPDGATVVWKAVYSDEDAGSFGSSYLFSIAGSGVFEVAEDAKISASSAGVPALYVSQSASIRVTGGEVAANGTSDGSNAIRSQGTGSIEVSGGTVSSVNYRGITSESSGNVTVSGGTVSSASTTFPTISATSGNITVSGGGTVQSTGSVAIINYFGNVTVSGGTITAATTAISAEAGVLAVSGGTITSGASCVSTQTGAIEVTGGELVGNGTSTAVGVYSTGTAKITGGTVDNVLTAIYVNSGGVAAYLTGTCETGTFIVGASGGMIIEVDALVIPASWDGDDIGLWWIAGGGTAIWDLSGATPIIAFILTDESTPSITWGSKEASNPPNGGSGGSSSSSSSTTAVPKTGDNTNMLSWGIALAVSVMGIVSLPIAKKKMSK